MLYKSFLFTIILVLVISLQNIFAQTPVPAPIRVTGYISAVHPIVTISDAPPAYNFSNSYTVGIPMGINLWKNSKIGFSFEIAPFIRSDNTGSKTSNVLIHPGVLVPLRHGFTFVGRAAFETAGRYGLTPVINKVIVKSKNCNYFIAVPFPIRFGDNKPASIGVGFQLGIAF